MEERCRVSSAMRRSCSGVGEPRASDCNAVMRASRDASDDPPMSVSRRCSVVARAPTRSASASTVGATSGIMLRSASGRRTSVSRTAAWSDAARRTTSPYDPSSTSAWARRCAASAMDIRASGTAPARPAPPSCPRRKKRPTGTPSAHSRPARDAMPSTMNAPGSRNQRKCGEVSTLMVAIVAREPTVPMALRRNRTSCSSTVRPSYSCSSSATPSARLRSRRSCSHRLRARFHCRQSARLPDTGAAGIGGMGGSCDAHASTLARAGGMYMRKLRGSSGGADDRRPISPCTSEAGRRPGSGGGASRVSSRATRNIVASLQRSAGFLASAFDIACVRPAGASGRSMESGLGVSERCFTSMAGVFDALNGVSPVSS